MDQVLRLLHPTIPFITERLWTELNRVVPQRGLPSVVDLVTDTQLIRAPFPPVEGYPALDDPDIVAEFANLQKETRAVREARSQHGVSPKENIKVTFRTEVFYSKAIQKYSYILGHMMGTADDIEISPEAKRPKNSASVTVGRGTLFIHGISNDEADLKQTKKTLEQIEKQIAGKEAKLANEKFLANAKPEIVGAERERLDALKTQQASLQGHLTELEG